MNTGQLVVFVAPDGTEHEATVAYVWGASESGFDMLNVAVNAAVDRGDPNVWTRERPKVHTSVPHRSQVVGAKGYYWKEAD